MPIPRLYSFADLEAAMQVSRRTLQRVTAELGYRRGPGRKRMLFTAQQVAAIEQRLSCRSKPDEPARRHPAPDDGAPQASGIPEARAILRRRRTAGAKGTVVRLRPMDRCPH